MNDTPDAATSPAPEPDAVLLPASAQDAVASRLQVAPDATEALMRSTQQLADAALAQAEAVLAANEAAIGQAIQQGMDAQGDAVAAAHQQAMNAGAAADKGIAG